MKQGYVKIKAEHLFELYLTARFISERFSEEVEEDLRPHINAAKAALRKHDHIGFEEAVKESEKDN
ncbi:MAG: hypothetical protein LBE32_05445 [Burkholderiales bacterium]|jgi:hypothetical protein|nr:hypothetical protein [Burkholderiales bacterium]